MEHQEKPVGQEEQVGIANGTNEPRVSRRRLLGMGAVGLSGAVLAGMSVKPASAADGGQTKDVSLTDFLSLMVAHPELTHEVKADPQKIAGRYGWRISEADVVAIKQNFHVDEFLASATAADTPASKTAAGVQINKIA